VDVLYAGSMEHLMEDVIGPAFSSATGYTYQGYGAGSDELVSDIRDGVRRADVFVSASPASDLALEGAAKGGWVSWYATFATAPLVIGYNPSSRFAGDFRTEPWYEVVTRPGILVGRTDPLLDPKGKLTAEAIQQAAARLRDPALTGALPGWQVFPEQTLVGRLEAGQLDAGFFYSFEATAQRIPTVPLTPVTLGATFTVTVVNRAPDPAGARAFAAYLLGPSGRSRLRAQGVRVQRATLSGPIAAVPDALRPLVGGGG
jgi:molybdate/tungstate transport system substrate-binding protein